MFALWVQFTIDTKPTAMSSAALTTSQTAASASGAVWFDEDDEQLRVDLEATNRLKKLKTGDMTSAVVSGAEYTELLQSRYEAKKATWALPTSSTGLDEEEDEDVLDAEDYQLLTEAGGLLRATGGRRDRFAPIAPETISMKRLADGNVAEYCAKGVSSVQFHPVYPNLLLVASEDKNLRVFDLDDQHHEKLLGVQFKDLPILSARFIGTSGDEIIVTGRKPFYYVYGMGTGQVAQFQVPAHKRPYLKTLERMTVSPNGVWVVFVGQEGSIHLVDARSKQWVWEGKMNCSVRAAQFLDNRTLLTSGFDAEVYYWDIAGGDVPTATSSSRGGAVQRSAVQVTCRHRMANADGTSSLSLATYTPPSAPSSSSGSSSASTAATAEASSGAEEAGSEAATAVTPQCYCIPDVDYVCVGAMSGVATIFQRPASASASGAASSGGDASGESSFSLMKSVMNLTTKVTSMAFHPSGQLLAIASGEKKDQLKLVHLPTGSVYMNWPRLIALSKQQQAAEPGRRASPLHRVTCVQFSPDGSRLAIGNGRGRVLLYQLNHFTDYHERRYRELQAKKEQQRQQAAQAEASAASSEPERAEAVVAAVSSRSEETRAAKSTSVVASEQPTVQAAAPTKAPRSAKKAGGASKKR